MYLKRKIFFVYFWKDLEFDNTQENLIINKRKRMKKKLIFQKLYNINNKFFFYFRIFVF